MAKRQPPSPKPAKSSAHGPDAAQPDQTASSSQAQPQRRATYAEAVALYERGLEALQRHDFDAAASRLESVLRLYPDEKELHERVRLYLNVCERQLAPRDTDPQTLDERLYAATLAINGGRYDRAIANLRLVRDEDPDNDHALYMLAVAHAQRGEPAEAIAHLERAIALNPENRGIAKTDPDLDPLRGDEAFRIALDTPPIPRADRRPRPPVRPRTAR